MPLHPQVLELGFLDFVDASPEGPLFYPARQDKDAIVGARTVAGRVSQWLQKLEVVPTGVSPNHGWRHRFKTVGCQTARNIVPQSASNLDPLIG